MHPGDNMDTKEIGEAKAALDENLTAQIVKFQKDTGLLITDIEVTFTSLNKESKQDSLEVKTSFIL